ncbi:hypothetical protein [Halomonas sp.]|uniref:hypothetical protein n=1 Tax=Halomonas sp. TaxID=1486246 RepID=UPI003D09A4B2
MPLVTAGADIATVFRQHGITIAIGAPVMSIYELAMAVSLNNRYRASAAYYGQDHLFEVTVAEKRGGMWVSTRTMAVALPTHNSDERQRQLATQDLGGIAEVLHELLKEGPAS